MADLADIPIYLTPLDETDFDAYITSHYVYAKLVWQLPESWSGPADYSVLIYTGIKTGSWQETIDVHKAILNPNVPGGQTFCYVMFPRGKTFHIEVRCVTSSLPITLSVCAATDFVSPPIEP